MKGNHIDYWDDTGFTADGVLNCRLLGLFTCTVPRPSINVWLVDRKGLTIRQFFAATSRTRRAARAQRSHVAALGLESSAVMTWPRRLVSG